MTIQSNLENAVQDLKLLEHFIRILLKKVACQKHHCKKTKSSSLVNKDACTFLQRHSTNLQFEIYGCTFVSWKFVGVHKQSWTFVQDAINSFLARKLLEMALHVRTRKVPETGTYKASQASSSFYFK